MSDEKSFFDKAKEFASNLGEDISEGIEKAGDFIEEKLGGDSHEDAAGAVEDAASSAGDAVSDAASSATDAASDAASSAGDAVSDAVDAAKDAVSDATDGS